MQKNEILEFLGKIDAHLKTKFPTELAKKKFELKIFGKSALMLAGLEDSSGTIDIDILHVEGQASKGANPEIIGSLPAGHSYLDPHHVIASKSPRLRFQV